VFQLAPSAGGGWTERVLHDFNPKSNDGSEPYGGVIFDAAGNLYGTTVYGGPYDYGTVFELTPTGGNWTEKLLHTFNKNGKDGYWPSAGLLLDAAGNLYSTTYAGGAYGFGTVFEMTPTAAGGWTERSLHNFKSNVDSTKDGASPDAGLIFDGAGDLYGTTYAGGAYGSGTVFELLPAAGGRWSAKVLHMFNPGGNDGYQPQAALIFDAAGNLYGTTTRGGSHGFGIVFEVTP
jgi:uncharacterized repeat protein (TIGR03803 family)